MIAKLINWVCYYPALYKAVECSNKEAHIKAVDDNNKINILIDIKEWLFKFYSLDRDDREKWCLDLVYRSSNPYPIKKQQGYLDLGKAFS